MEDTETTTPPKQLTRSISMDAETDKIIETYSEASGIGNYSASIRMIVREWNEARKRAKRLERAIALERPTPPVAA